MESKKAHSRTFWIIAAGVLCLLLVFAFLLPNLYARYKTNQTRSNNAVVAGWSVSAELPSVLGDIVVGGDVCSDYVVTLSNAQNGIASQTAVSCAILLEGVPEGVSISLYPGNESTGTAINTITAGASGSVTFENVYIFPPSQAESKEFTLHFTAGDSVVHNDYPLKVRATFTQVD